MTIPGFTSTGSKRPEALFGTGGPTRMRRAVGCRLWDSAGREYLDTIMALGAVALGYAHPAVVEAVEQAVRDGAVGSLPPVHEGEVAERLASVIPGAQAVRFFKTGAEAVAAAVRIARVHTGRDRVITCGYHGWLDWCQDGAGVPRSTLDLRRTVPFDEPEVLEIALDEWGPVGAIVLEPVVERAPGVEWLRAARAAASRHGAVLIFDEIKTAFRIAVGGAAERYGVVPDLTVVGKALGNGFPLAAVCGAGELMDAVTRTWVSSTLATEYVSLAAAGAVLETFERERVASHLARVGRAFYDGLDRIARQYPELVVGVGGIPQMCFLAWRDERVSTQVALEAARRGILFKRNAYNFVSLAHTEEVIAVVLERLATALSEVARLC